MDWIVTSSRMYILCNMMYGSAIWKAEWIFNKYVYLYYGLSRSWLVFFVFFLKKKRKRKSKDKEEEEEEEKGKEKEMVTLLDSKFEMKNALKMQKYFFFKKKSLI